MLSLQHNSACANGLPEEADITYMENNLWVAD